MRKGFVLPIILLAIIVVVAVMGILQFRKSKIQPTQKQASIVNATPASLPSPVSSVKLDTSKLPSGWTYVVSKYCNVVLPMPPAHSVDISDYSLQDQEGLKSAFWEFQEYGNSAKTLKRGRAFISVNPGSGAIFNGVDIECDENKDLITIDDFIEEEKLLQQRQLSLNPEEKYAVLMITNLEELKLWGGKALKIHIEGGFSEGPVTSKFGEDYSSKTEFTNINKKNIYKIRKSASTQKNKDIVDFIFNNLQFLE